MRAANVESDNAQKLTNAKMINDNETNNHFALVELFTSEGCSSCPSADNLVNATIAENKPNVYVLSFHVDYWNRLGWKDEYSTASFSDRQRAYATALGLEGVYTPQIVVNGKAEFVGSNPTKLSNAIAPKNQTEMKSNIALQLSLNKETITVSAQAELNADATLHIALVQKHAETQVKNGENEGLTLKHSNIVRALKSFTDYTTETTTTFQLPEGLQAKDVEVVIFLQDTKNLQVLSATKGSL